MGNLKNFFLSNYFVIQGNKHNQNKNEIVLKFY